MNDYRMAMVMAVVTILLALAARRVDRHPNLSVVLTALTILAFGLWLTLSVMTMRDWGWL